MHCKSGARLARRLQPHAAHEPPSMGAARPHASLPCVHPMHIYPMGQVNNDVTLSAAHNLANKALKTGITYNTKARGCGSGRELRERRGSAAAAELGGAGRSRRWRGRAASPHLTPAACWCPAVTGPVACSGAPRRIVGGPLRWPPAARTPRSKGPCCGMQPQPPGAASDRGPVAEGCN